MLYLLAALFASPAHACDTQALFSCQAEFTFVSGLQGPGPEDAAPFASSGDDNNLLCAAKATIKVEGTGVQVESTASDFGGVKKFSLLTTEGNASRNEGFAQVDDHTIHADIAIASQPGVVFGGKTEKLRILAVTCRVTP